VSQVHGSSQVAQIGRASYTDATKPRSPRGLPCRERAASATLGGCAPFQPRWPRTFRT